MEAKPTFTGGPSHRPGLRLPLGGKRHTRVDRAIGEIFNQRVPGGPDRLDNRAALVRAVTFIAEEIGNSQSHRLDPVCDRRQWAKVAHAPFQGQVVYVDNDPIVLAHGSAMPNDGMIRTVVVKGRPSASRRRSCRPGTSRTDRIRPARFVHHRASRGRALTADEEDPLRDHPREVRATSPREPACRPLALRTLGDPDSRARRVMLEAFGRGTWRHQRASRFGQLFGDMRLNPPGMCQCDRVACGNRSRVTCTFTRSYRAGLGRK